MRSQPFAQCMFECSPFFRKHAPPSVLHLDHQQVTWKLPHSVTLPLWTRQGGMVWSTLCYSDYTMFSHVLPWVAELFFVFFFHGGRCYFRRLLCSAGSSFCPCPYFILDCTGRLSITGRGWGRGHVCRGLCWWSPWGSRQAPILLLSSWKPADPKTGSAKQRRSEE